MPQPGTIRPLAAEEWQHLRDHLGRLDAESRRARFGMATDDAFIDAYARRSQALDGVVYGYFEDGILRAAAELRPVLEPAGDEGELAFSVETPWRRQGLGTALFGTMLAVARRRGFERLYLSYLTWNAPMRGLARKFASEITCEDDGAIVTLRMPPRTAATMLKGMLGETLDMAAAYVDPQRRFLKRPPFFASRE